MRILTEKGAIISVDSWRELAPPKRGSHWLPGRSAYELAYAWCGTGTPVMPAEVRALLDTRVEARGLVVDEVFPEYRIAFDSHAGEPRNADLAFTGVGPTGRVAVTVEAKADEPFGDTVAATISSALERAVCSPESRGVDRVRDLVRMLFRPRAEGEPPVSDLRYQLLTATAGSLSYALEVGASSAVLLVHEFQTKLTSEARRARNQQDFKQFLRRLTGHHGMGDDPHALIGPIAVPDRGVSERKVELFIGKVATVC